MPLVHILRDSKRRTGAVAEGVCGSAASLQSETKDRIPPSPPVQPIRTFVFVIKQGKSLNLSTSSKDLEEKLTRKTPKLGINPFATINVANNVANNVAKKERLEIILEKLKKNIIFSKRSLATELNVDKKTIERDLEILKQQNKIIFIGSRKSGSWKIIN